MLNNFKNSLVEFAVVKYKLCLLLAVILFISGLPFLGNIKLDFSAKVWFRAHDHNIKTLELFEKTFGNDEVVNLIVESEEGVFNPDFITMLGKITEEMWLVPEVIRAQSLTNFYWSYAEEDDLVTERGKEHYTLQDWKKTWF